MREKLWSRYFYNEVCIEENKIVSFNRSNSYAASYRVIKDGFMGVYWHRGCKPEEECFLRAEENLALKRPYKFTPETGVRRRDKTERVLTDRELLELAGETVEYLGGKYPDFIFNGSVSQWRSDTGMSNENGLDYSDIDCNADINISYKHKDSRDLSDGSFCLGQRDYDIKKFFEIADNNLQNYGELLEIPEELIIQVQYYGLVDSLNAALNGEALALGTSLLTGKIGQKVFAEDFTYLHDASDCECWHTSFWDNEGCVNENDRRIFIENGVPLYGITDKWSADKYNIPHTANSACGGADIPCGGVWISNRIKRSGKTVKELLDGRLTVIPVQYSGGGFNEKGDYTMPVHNAFLCDGEKILGRVPPFTMQSSMFDIFGDGFIGVGSDDPVFGDKHILTAMKKI